MNKFKIINHCMSRRAAHTVFRCLFAFFMALIMLNASGLAASAADTASLDFGLTGSVTLTLADSDGNTVSGGEITLYQVAVLYLDNGSMAYEYTDAFESCGVILDVTDFSLAKIFAEYVEKSGVTGSAAAVGADGTVTFSDLKLGLYLTVQTAVSEQYETIDPFLVTVPIDSDGVWEYAVSAEPKVGTVTTKETTTSPSEETTTASSEETTAAPSGETITTASEETTTTLTILPQTGQLNWPVPVLTVCSLLFFGIGWVLKRSEQKENDL